LQVIHQTSKEDDGMTDCQNLGKCKFFKKYLKTHNLSLKDNQYIEIIKRGGDFE